MNTSTPRPKGVIALRGLAVLQALAIAWMAAALLGQDPPKSTVDALRSARAEDDRSDDLLAKAKPMVEPAPERATTTKVSEPHSERTPFVPPAGSIVLAIVRDDSGRVPRHARLSLRLENTTEILERQDPDARGVARFAGLAPGSYELFANCDGHREARVSFTCAEGTPPQRLELRLVASWILGVRFETSDGRAHHELRKEWVKRDRRFFDLHVSAIATRWEPERDFPLSSLRDNFYGLGLWRNFSTMARPEFLPEGCIEYLELEEREPLWVSAALRHRVLAKQRVEPTQSVVVFKIDEAELFAQLATLRVRIVDALRAQPVPGARVELSDQQSGGSGEVTDAEGRIELRHLRPGWLVLSATKDGASTSDLRVQLEPGEILDLGDLPIRATQSVSVRCEGLPSDAKDFYLWAIALDPPPHAALKSISHRAISTGGDGFRFQLPEGRYALRATGAGGASLEIDTRALGAEPVVLRLAPEAAFRIDSRAKGEAIEMAISDASGRRVARYVLSFDRPFEIWSLPGPHKIELTGRDGVTVVREVALPPEGLNVQVP
ncbi:MAG: carboxypeptidase regulatory-like domain-containing protein [Planctomycetes bacterium]|nr:carboxypeptidase regulatory-like domain-containing protein [Planctomycetota bacterium]